MEVDALRENEWEGSPEDDPNLDLDALGKGKGKGVECWRCGRKATQSFCVRVEILPGMEYVEHARGKATAHQIAHREKAEHLSHLRLEKEKVRARKEHNREHAIGT